MLELNPVTSKIWGQGMKYHLDARLLKVRVEFEDWHNDSTKTFLYLSLLHLEAMLQQMHKIAFCIMRVNLMEENQVN